MRGCVKLLVVVLLASSPAALAEETLKPDQLKKAYDAALIQLKSAQDRKAELAKDNEALAAKVEEMKKQLAASQSQIESQRRQIADHEERTFFLRSYHAAWQNFLRQHPEVMARWKLYLGDSALSIPQDAPDWLSPEWPVPTTG